MMGIYGRLKTNWRIVLLVVLLGASFYFLFVPGAPITELPGSDDEPQDDIALNLSDGNESEAQDLEVDTGWTNLQFGIELGGGARIAAPVHGFVAEDVQNLDDDATADEIRSELVASMNISEADVNIYTDEESPQELAGVVEVTAKGNQSDFENGLENAGVDIDDVSISTGVTDYTRDQIVDVLSERLDATGLGGSSVTTSHSPGGETRVVVEAPGQSISDLEEQINYRGQVETQIQYPNGTTETVLTIDDFASIGLPDSQDGQPYVPVTLTDSAAEKYQQTLIDSGFIDAVLESDEDEMVEYRLQTVIDGETIWEGGMTRSLAQSIDDGDFAENPSFQIQTTTDGEASTLHINLIAGELPSDLNLDDSNDYELSPTLAQDFKIGSLIVGLFAIFAVVMMVFLRYGEPQVAVPMSVTAMSEVIILLGFAAAIGMPIDLAHVAGFIVVVGTGVDDLIIIADEVMSEGEVNSHKVFDSRFKKAFWIIGAAASTTLIAMGPLAILDLGDLRGFAIITIIGVLIGVLVTRPAYGNILRILKTRGK
ncbi:preprotein translocase subunit SecD [Salinarchaeum sp. IM2453]|uniref:preprotein translocase subunit SecD n=1 Tax=Salinarchaeum sp. IM2453 TaxID=2862870 RepID=UPI001C833671|nr:preprotein translocase subunit SecD [Salinarchaeum sp. IM2453]QZA88891.1 preprotein translocase subunit SecD [Salinarchaeum sp. IM2453]